VDSTRARRRIRHAGYAALLFAAYLLLVLPMPLHHAPGDMPWAVEWVTIAQVGLSLLLAVLALRGVALAGAVLGVYGVYRIALFALAIVRVLDGTAASIPWGPAWVLVAVVLVPFAVFWIRGGLAALALLRTRRESPMAAI
jgi:hypothetical protein